MRTVFLLCMLSFSALKSFGQISGKVNNLKGEPVPFANVVLYAAKDTSIITGTSTDENGIFLINQVKTGEFFIQISSIGYKTFQSKPFAISESNQKFQIADTELPEESNALAEIEVSAKKDLIENTPTGKIINIQSSLMTKGSNALQVLERLPGVILDRRNNQFSLNGQNGVTIMFNGRKVPMSVEELMTLLESTVADNIEKIELITSPTAQYDADGGAGIINIIFKNNENLGTKVNVSATAGYGFREKAVASAGISQGYKKLHFNVSYSFLHDVSRSGFAGNGTSNNPNVGGESTGAFFGFTRRFQDTHNANFTAEFRPDAKTTLGGDLAFSYLHAHNLVNNGGFWDVKDAEYVGRNALSDGLNTRQNLISSVYLKRNLSDKQQLNFDASYIVYHNNSPNIINTDYFDRDGNPFVPQNPIFTFGNRGESVSKIQVGVLKADYSLKINDKINAEFGAKGSLAQNTNDSKVERKVNDNWEIDPRSQSSVYSQEQILAFYSQFRFLLNSKSNLQAGLRYEYWNRDINIYKDAFTIAQLFPTVLYTYNLNDNAAISLTYNRRISRPAYADLVSNLFYNDPTFVFSGNPLLKPTLTDVAKVDFTVKGYTIGLSLQNDINPILRYQITTNETKDIGISSPQNLDYQKSVNLFLSVPVQIFSWWKVSLSSTTALRRYKISYSITPAEKTYLYQNFNFSQSISLPKNFEIELSGWRNLGFPEGSNRLESFGVINLGVAKKLKNDKGTFQLTLPDVFQSLSIYTHIGVVAPLVFNINSVSNWKDETVLYRVIKLTYSRSFGKNSYHINYHADGEEQQRVK